MGFLLRIAFWFSLVLLVLPLGTPDGSDTPSVGPVETFLAARQAIGDVTSICERQPAACEVGRSALQTVGVRAKEAARIAYHMLDESMQTPDVVTTGTVQPDTAVALPEVAPAPVP
jgi:hypothetical protein